MSSLIELPARFSRVYEIYSAHPSRLPDARAKVEKFKKQGEDLSVESYSVRAVERIVEPALGVVPNANFGFELRRENRGIAVIMYDFFPNLNGLNDIHLVRQIQARKDAFENLRFLRWERMMLEFATEAIFFLGYDKLAVEPAEQNRWYERYGEGSGMYEDSLADHQARMRMRYNITAERSGFRLDPSSGLFIRQHKS